MGYARDANTFISIVRLLPKVRNMLSSTRIPVCLETERERVWFTHKFESSLLNIYFRLSRFQSSLLPIYSRNGPNRCSLCTKVWHKTHPICHAPLSRSVRHSLLSVTEIATPQPFMCVSRSPLRYDFYDDAKAI